MLGLDEPCKYRINTHVCESIKILIVKNIPYMGIRVKKGDDKMLNEKKVKMIDYIIEGNLDKTEIAKTLDVSRQTIYDWMKDDEVIAEYDRRLQASRTDSNRRLQACLNPLLNKLYNIAMYSKSARDSKDAAVYLVNRVLGTPKESISVQDNNDESIDPLAIFNQIISNADEKITPSTDKNGSNTGEKIPD